jgi:glucosamine--fructose-6-phosphate aminotransferase (isomerizing)
MSLPMVENILAQGSSLEGVIAHQYGEGRQALVDASRLLRSSKQIVLSGMGVSYNVCLPLSNFFAQRGIMAPVIETAELLYFQSELLGPQTTLVLVSRSGESVEATKALALARERGANVIAVVNVPESTLAAHATQTILVNSAPDQLASIQTYSGSMAVLLLLGAAFDIELDGGVRAELERTAGILTRWSFEWLRFSGGWPGFFANAMPKYVLGRGASLSSALTGALLLQEVVKIPAMAMSSAQFRHGPVEVVDEQFHAIVFGTQRRTEPLDATLAARLADMGAKVRWIGPEQSSSKIVSLCEWPGGVPERFIPLVDVVPLQIVAYETARWHGLTIGDLKYATPVTLSEHDFASR